MGSLRGHLEASDAIGIVHVSPLHGNQQPRILEYNVEDWVIFANTSLQNAYCC